MVATSTQPLTLSTGSSSLVIETESNGWARCFLVEDKRIYLGADSIEIVLARLRDAVDAMKPLDCSAGWKLEGLPVAWRLSLAEVHHVLYVGEDEADRVLFWQNAHTSPVSIAGIMRLSPAQCQQWVQVLSHALKEAEEPSLVAA